jgi:hypothetical protein
MYGSPILLLHIAAGAVGLLSGGFAVCFRKGARGHAIAGNVFFVSMLMMSGCGALMAAMKSQPGNIVGGALTFYLVATAWVTARRQQESTGLFDWAALLVTSAVVATAAVFGFKAATSPTGLSYGFPVGPYAFLGSIALIAAVGDVRMLARYGVAGSQRIARHLWRMCFALFIASSSVLLARAQVFPAFMRTTGILYILTILPIVLMIYWLIRVRFAKAWKRQPLPRTAGAYPAAI